MDAGYDTELNRYVDEVPDGGQVLKMDNCAKVEAVLELMDTEQQQFHNSADIAQPMLPSTLPKKELSIEEGKGEEELLSENDLDHAEQMSSTREKVVEAGFDSHKSQSAFVSWMMEPQQDAEGCSLGCQSDSLAASAQVDNVGCTHLSDPTASEPTFPVKLDVLRQAIPSDHGDLCGSQSNQVCTALSLNMLEGNVRQTTHPDELPPLHLTGQWCRMESNIEIDRHISSDLSQAVTDTGGCPDSPQCEHINSTCAHMQHVELSKQRLCRQQWLVHRNPDMSYSEFAQSFPDTPRYLFGRWKQEVQMALNCIRNQHVVTYKDIASVLPDVAPEMFDFWQKFVSETFRHVAEGTSKCCSSSLVPFGSSLYVKDQNDVHLSSAIAQTCNMTTDGDEGTVLSWRCSSKDNYIAVMLNPTMDYTQFSHLYNTVSQRTFYRWRAHIRDWRSEIHNDPSITFEAFSKITKEVPEYVFNIWRDLEIQSRGRCIEESIMAPYFYGHSDSRLSDTETCLSNSFFQQHRNRINIYAFDFYQRHLDISFESFVSYFPTVPAELFQQWKEQVDMTLEYIRRIPRTNFSDFHNLFPDIQEDVFNIWKARVLNPETISNTSFTCQHVSAENLFTSCHLTHTSSFTLPSTYSLQIPKSCSPCSVTISSSNPFHCVSMSCDVLNESICQSVSSSPMFCSASTSKENCLDNIDDCAEVRYKPFPISLPSFTETISNIGRLNSLVQDAMPSLIYPSTLKSSPVVFASPASCSASSLGINFANVNCSVISSLPNCSLQQTMRCSWNQCLSKSSISHSIEKHTGGTAVDKHQSQDDCSLASCTMITEKDMVKSGNVLNLRGNTHMPLALPVINNSMSDSVCCKGDIGDESAPLIINDYDANRQKALTGRSYDTHSTIFMPNIGTQQLEMLQNVTGVCDSQGRCLPAEGAGEHMEDSLRSMHSSQRQRKLQRLEYMFMEQNPGVDLQEFQVRFPNVSLRTFYRWKREIREDTVRRRTAKYRFLGGEHQSD